MLWRAAGRCGGQPGVRDRRGWWMTVRNDRRRGEPNEWWCK